MGYLLKWLRPPEPEDDDPRTEEHELPHQGAYMRIGPVDRSLEDVRWEWPPR
jgi:hypothetical protein